jgi:hypothetical protein
MHKAKTHSRVASIPFELLEPRQLMSAAPVTFAAATPCVNVSYVSDLVTADFNHDGKTDVAVVVKINNNWAVEWFAGDGKGNLAAQPHVIGGVSNPYSLATGDYNGDGYADLAIGNQYNTVYVALNNQAGGLQPVQSATLPQDVGAMVSVYAHDSNSENLAVGMYNGGGIAVISVNILGQLFIGQTIPDAHTIKSLAVGEFDGDFASDLVAVGYPAGAPTSPGTVDFFYGNTYPDGTPDGTFTAGQSLAAGVGPNQVLATDLNKDGQTDIILSNYGDDWLKIAGSVQTLLGHGNSVFDTPSFAPAANHPRGVVAADFGGGKIDSIVADLNAGLLLVNGNGDGTFAAAGTKLPNSVWAPVGVWGADMNNDGKLDLVATDNAGEIYTILNTTGDDLTPPSAAIASAPNVTVAGGTSYTFSITITDDSAVLASSLDNNDFVVNDGGLVLPVTLVSKSTNANDKSITATYKMIPPGGSWDWSDNDSVYAINTQPNQVSDIHGNFLAGGVTVGKFSVNVPGAPDSSISGVVFNDANGNGVKDNGETGRGGITVYIDANNNGKFDEAEDCTMSLANGNYSFEEVFTGTYKLREVLPANWKQTSPANNAALTVAVAKSQSVTGKNFAEEALPGSIAGTVFNDANINGSMNAGEAPLAGVKMYLDKNANGQFDAGEPYVLTNASGQYKFSNLAPGSYHVRQVHPSGYRTYQPGTNEQDVTITPALNVTAKNFADTKRVLISGVVFHDTNKNGSQNAGESGLSGWTVFNDANNNGVLDAGEASVLTDATGHYTFANLFAGTFHIREVVKPGHTRVAPASGVYTLTLAAGQTAGSKNFANT